MLVAGSVCNVKSRYKTLKPAELVTGDGRPLPERLAREITREMERLAQVQAQIVNRRQVASYIGITPCAYDSGDGHRSQGISKAGNRLARVAMIEAAWLWVRHQPGGEYGVRELPRQSALRRR